MEAYELKIIESVIVLISYLVLRYSITKVAEKVSRKLQYQRVRIKVVKKLINFILFSVNFGFFIIIWGVDQSELIIFISSVLTILGVILFAQWSLLSNITATIIIFFYHSAKIDDTITVFDNDYPIEGRISDIGVFFIIITTTEGEKITIPSNLFMQKMIKHSDNRLSV